MIPYVQHLCASGTNAWGLRHHAEYKLLMRSLSHRLWEVPKRKEIWREISWFWQGNLTEKKEIWRSKRENSLKTYGSTAWNAISSILGVEILQNSEDYKVHRRHKFSQTFLIFYSELNKLEKSPWKTGGAGQRHFISPLWSQCDFDQKCRI
jgi:hypothetical protein